MSTATQVATDGDSATRDAQVTVVTTPDLQPPRPAAPRAGNAPFLSREQMIEATDRSFAEAGYDGTTIRAIAGRLLCSVGSIYRYFEDKRDLLLACGERMMRPVFAELDEPGVGFERSLRTYLGAASARSELYRLQFWLAATGRGGGGVPRFTEAIIDRWGELLGDRAEAERRWATAHGLLMLGYGEERIVEGIGLPAGEASAKPRVAMPFGDPTRRAAGAEEPYVEEEDMTLL